MPLRMYALRAHKPVLSDLYTIWLRFHARLPEGFQEVRFERTGAG